ncbi:T9SS type A sorting domain-containing protein [Aequorivita echinoideorum]|uniref:T9SS type A sorting domain-containing protein n=1 Tax=Aequorivita echinoideorum TaxID=1549647 RepID=A0ABS5S4M1_9FLAO|nr:T9SS type A sorting domain-containing protein [Aequorivita echinoideorum]MBT0607923.1 T9SS type A sorting domain-containing protein [Aequorivita echinoideorum]
MKTLLRTRGINCGFLLFLGLFFCILNMQGQIISQYVETDSGTTPKGIEIWNNTSSSINFATNNLQIFQGTNGAALSAQSGTLINTGILEPNEVLVIGTTDIGTYLTNQGLTAVRFIDFGFSFNGNDALQVRLGSTATDTFGTPGSNPGSSWAGSGVSTANQNIQLNQGITSGSTGFTDPSVRFNTVSSTPSSSGGLAGFGIAPISNITYTFDNNSWTPADPDLSAPTAADNILILNGTATLTTVININDVTVNAGATLNIENVLNLNGDLTNNGDLIFASSATANGELGPVPPTSTISGNATVQNYMSAIRAYRLISSAVTTTNNAVGSQSINANWQEGVNNPDINTNLNPNEGFGTHITGSQTGQNGFDATPSGNPSMYTLNATAQAFEAVSNTNTNTLNAGQPYLLFVRGDRSIDVTSNASNPTITRLRATGSLQTGNITQSNLSEIAGGFSAIGNPYQCAVDMELVLANSTNLSTDFFYIYDATLNTNGAYVTIDMTDGGTNTAGSPANQFLQPGQGAQVITLAAGPASILFEESDKAPGAASFYQTDATSTATASIIGQLYTTENFTNGGKLHDSFGIKFSADYSNAVNEKDALKPNNFRENMGIKNGDAILSIEKRELPVAGETIQLNNYGYYNSDYTLVIQNNAVTTVDVFLEDTFTGEVNQLMEGENIVTFSVDATDPMSIDEDRFQIVFVEKVLGVNDNAVSNFTLYPNPLTANGFYISIGQQASTPVEVSVVDMQGRVIFSNTFDNAESSFKVSLENSLAAGIYIANVSYNGATTSQKIVKQ